MDQMTNKRAGDVWLARVYFFVWVSGIGFFYPFLNLFYRQQGLSGTEIGIILTCSSVVGLIASPLWGRWSDSGASLTRILQLGLVTSGIALVLLSQQSAFLLLALIASLYSLVSSGLFPLSDTLALRLSAARRAGYAGIRVWGSVGWSAVVLVSGWIIERTSLVTGFFGGALAYFSAALVLVGISHTMPAPAVTPERGKKQGSLGASLGEIVKTRALLGLGLALIVRGALSDGHMQFGNIYLEQLGASDVVIGIASMLGAVVEVPGFFLADRVVKRIGATRSLLVSFVITGGKLFLVLAFPSVWAILVTRAVEGIAFSIYVIGVLTYVTERAAPARTSTMLALFSVTLLALIQILGAPIGGIVFDAVGALWLYALAVIGNALAFSILIVFRARG